MGNSGRNLLLHSRSIYVKIITLRLSVGGVVSTW